jgi:hypothetical protein
MRTLIASVLLLASTTGYAPNLEEAYRHLRDERIMLPYSDFSEANLRLMLHGNPYMDIIIAQAKLETGGYTSRIFRESNNLFGMRHPRIRPSTSLGSRYNHAFYGHFVKH